MSAKVARSIAAVIVAAPGIWLLSGQLGMKEFVGLALILWGNNISQVDE